MQTKGVQSQSAANSAQGSGTGKQKPCLQLVDAQFVRIINLLYIMNAMSKTFFLQPRTQNPHFQSFD